MITVHTKPRQITVDYLRPGDEVAVWKDYNDELFSMWKDRYEDQTTWLSVHEITVADPDRPNGPRIVTWWGGDKREIDQDQFIVIRESVQVDIEV